MKNQTRRLGLLWVLFLWLAASAGQSAETAGPLLECGNLIYAGTKSSVCFADQFLSDVAKDTTLKVAKNFRPVKLESDGVFDLPFCVFSGEDTFTLTEKERQNLRKYVTGGGFILASPGCSDEKWDKAFRKEIQLCFPEYQLNKIPMSHAIFSMVNTITTLTCKNGNTALLEGLEVNGRLAVIYSKEGLNDVRNAKGCCCCGGNMINDSIKVNVNIFTYSLLY